jgi:hypothetical protein
MAHEGPVQSKKVPMGKKGIKNKRMPKPKKEESEEYQEPAQP